ncbi:hypothetical protein [Melittangium boletus]|uniref:hypothetical protein n=1 Tax=Melittangium boletus TaxID=83453 RepID=UPI003DA341D8
MRVIEPRALRFLVVVLALSSRAAVAQTTPPQGADYIEACKEWAKYAKPTKPLLATPRILVKLKGSTEEVEGSTDADDGLTDGVKAFASHEFYVACVPGKNRDITIRKPNESGYWEWKNPIIDFVDPQYIAWSTPSVRRRYAASSAPERRDVSNGFIFEAAIAPNLYSPQWVRKRESGTLVLSGIFTFQARLRMLNDSSSPVIPPSFMPKLSLQGLFLVPPVFGERGEFSHRYVLGAQATLGHHSNGQEGCFGGNETGFDGANCQPDDSLPAYPPNEISGSYSTNYLRMTLMFRNIYGRDYAGDLSASWFLTGAYERHLSVLPGGISPRQASYTGLHHVLVTGGVEHPAPRFIPGRIVVEGAVDFSPDAAIAYKMGFVNARAMVKYRPANRGFGLFVGTHVGRDNYNILFSQGVTRYLFGLSYDGELYRGVEGL